MLFSAGKRRAIFTYRTVKRLEVVVAASAATEFESLIRIQPGVAVFRKDRLQIFKEKAFGDVTPCPFGSEDDNF